MLLPEILSFLLKDLLLSFPPFSFPSSFPALSPLPQRAIFHPIPLPSELPLLETCFILREVKWFLLLQRQSLSKASPTISAPVHLLHQCPIHISYIINSYFLKWSHLRLEGSIQLRRGVSLSISPHKSDMALLNVFKLSFKYFLTLKKIIWDMQFIILLLSFFKENIINSFSMK